MLTDDESFPFHVLILSNKKISSMSRQRKIRFRIRKERIVDLLMVLVLIVAITLLAIII